MFILHNFIKFIFIDLVINIFYEYKNNYRNSTLNKSWLIKPNQNLNRPMIRSHFNKPVECKASMKPTFTFSTITKISLGLASGSLVKVYCQKWVFCEEKATAIRLVGYKAFKDDHLKFDWKKFWEYLRPHIWYMIAAIAVSLFNYFLLVAS